jgi:hypothetical protein
MLGVMTDDSNTKTVFSSYRMFFAYGGSFIALGAWEPLCNWFKSMDYSNASSWQYAMVCIATLCFLGFLFCFSMTREHVKSVASESIGKDVKSLVRNSPWWILNGAALLSNFFNTVRGATAAYFFKDYISANAFLDFGVFNLVLYAGLFLMVGEVCNMIGVALAVPLSVKFGKKSTYIISLVCLVVFSVLFFFVPNDGLGWWLMMIFQVLISICTGIVSPLIWSMYADVADYAEQKDGTSSTGLIFSSGSMPRRYGGLNFPITPYTMCAEIVAQADAGFGNIWSLQDCIETLYEFGNEDQHSRFIPRICAGETMSMDLTEPDAGSDLQSVMLKATYDEANNCWRLNGVKRFITNGDANLHLVLARSEEGTHDGRGLSMFIYDKNDGGVDVRRIENKLGIHGSPTCELVYKNAKAELCGERKLGLIKYVMALMNGARLGIAAQSVGLSQAAYDEALAYAKDRKQFGKAIIEFPAVYDMLATIKAKLDAGRALLYQTSRYVDIKSGLNFRNQDSLWIDKNLVVFECQLSL